jgi:hypothetical protein
VTGLVAQWKFDEGAGTTAADASGNANTGTLTGTSWASGIYGTSLSFSGSSSYVSVKESTSIENTSQMSVGFWIYANANTNSDPRVLTKSYSWDIKLNGSGIAPQFSSAGKYAKLNYDLTLNQWQHILLTFSGGTVTAYVNGNVVPFSANTFTGTETIPIYKYGMIIGAVADLTGGYKGLLDDVRVYNRALSSSEALALYSATVH